jgi:hypothetical protein
MTKLSAAVILMFVPLCVTGCASSGFSRFDADQTRDDRLPREIVETIELSDFDLSTSRWAGSHHGVGFYVLQPSEGSGPCIAIADGAESSIACGAGGRVDVTTSDGFDIRLVPEYEPKADGWTAVSDNVRVRE